MDTKGMLRVGLFFGGQSSEHNVSIQSAKNILSALDRKKYQPLLIYISKSGMFCVCQESDFFRITSIDEDGEDIFWNVDREIALVSGGKGECVYLRNTEKKFHIDIAFPILHGPFGEDGTIQGLFQMAHIPFVGPGVLGSAIGMDKDVAKRLLRDSGFFIADFICVKKHQADSLDFQEVKERLGLPLFIKPANAGSSIGVSKVSSESEFLQALSNAYEHDTKVLIEESIVGREIECSVFGNDYPEASVPGEVIPTHEFYSYEAKYIDSNGAVLKIPTNLSEDVILNIQDIAVKVFRCLECFGMTRVDLFVTDENKIYVNEVNTIPGFTSVSMYPKLWEASGVSYGELLDKIIDFALNK